LGLPEADPEPRTPMKVMNSGSAPRKTRKGGGKQDRWAKKPFEGWTSGEVPASA